MGEREPVLAHRLAITGCGVVSPIGVGFQDFAEAVLEGRSGTSPVDGFFEESLPCELACFMPDFDVADYLGSKGTTFYDRTTALVVVACGLALQTSDLEVTDQTREQIGITIGSSMGSIKSISDYVRETLIQDRPYLVNPVLFPNTVMNCAAGQAAIWHRLKGVNATVSGGQLSSLLALRYAAMVLRQGYAQAVLVGGVEEFCPQLAWGFHHAAALADTDTLLGEGCCVFVVEEASAVLAVGRRSMAEILACEAETSGQATNGSALSEKLARCIERSLRRAGRQAEQVWAVAGSFNGASAFDRVELEGIARALGTVPPRLIRVKDLVGECYSAAGAFQLAALLASYRGTSAGQERLGLVTSVSPDGIVGCAVVRG